jgi:opacity protein-like surface antigen
MNPRRSILLAVLVVAGTTAPAQAQLVATPYIDTNVAGDVQTGRGGLGASVAYYFRGRLGFELDAEYHHHFFRDEDVAHLVPPEGVDLNTRAALFMGNVVAAFPVQGAAGIWCPYGAAGLGVIRAVFDSVVFGRGAAQGNYDTDQTNLAFNVGGGVMHALTNFLGFRIDVRYFHALVDEHAARGGYFKDYDFWRVSVGVTFGFPR